MAAKADDSEVSAEIVNQKAAKRLVLHAEALLQAEQEFTYSLIARKQLGNKILQKVGTCYPLSTLVLQTTAGEWRMKSLAGHNKESATSESRKNWNT